ncbi:hypothetical protein BKN37_13310 [Mycobacterium talmoniae]|nr:hypothetical protein BKN37_13310 [Mycobacterium talmoniae]
MGKRRLGVASCAAALIVTVAACSTTISGSAVMATSEAGPGGVHGTSLDPGNYPTAPRPPLGTAGDPTKGAVIEAQRMASNVVGPWEVDPALLTPGMETLVLKSPEAVGVVLDFQDALGAVAGAHNFIAGFSSVRTAYQGPELGGNELRWLSNIVLRFASPDDATAAAAEMAATSTNVYQDHSEDPTPTQPIAVPLYPATSAVTFEFNSGAKVLAYTAHGTYVLCQQVYSKDGPSAAADLVAATLDKQGPLIDRFQPTPVDQLSTLSLDPGGLLARTVPAAERNVNYGSYEPRGILHFDDTPPRSQTVFDAAHLQLATRGATNVYQTPDPTSARRIVDSFTTEVVERKYVPAAGIQGLPDAKCLTRKDNDTATFYCLAVVDRYAVEASSKHERLAHQLVSAQYLMLTTK